MTKILLKSVTISDKTSEHHKKVRDVLIERGKISAIGKLSDTVAKKEINGKGMILSQGWVDMRAWYADPGFEHKEDNTSGRLCAESGGFTHVTILPNNKPVTQTKNDISYLKSDNNGFVTELHPIAAVTLDTKGTDLTEMIDLHTAGAVAFSDGLKPLWHSDILLKALQYLQKFDGLLIDRPEDLNLNMFGVMNEGVISTGLGMKGMPNLAEDLVVERNISILSYAGGRLHLSCVSSDKTLKLIKEAKKRGLNITCDMASYQPLFEDSILEDYDTSYKVNPPIRTKKENKVLIKALQDDTIDVIVSNHTPHDAECKQLEFDLADFGIIGQQTLANDLVTLAQDVDIHDLIQKVTINPRNLLKINSEPIAESMNADLTLLDPTLQWTLNAASNQSKSENSPYWKKELTGKVVATFNNGQSYIGV